MCGADANANAPLLMIYEAQRYDFALFQDKVVAVAGDRVELGLGHGKRIKVRMDERFETVIRVLGTTTVGGIFVPRKMRVAAKLQDGKAFRQSFRHSPPIQQSKPDN